MHTENFTQLHDLWFQYFCSYCIHAYFTYISPYLPTAIIEQSRTYRGWHARLLHTLQYINYIATSVTGIILIHFQHCFCHWCGISLQPALCNGAHSVLPTVWGPSSGSASVERMWCFQACKCLSITAWVYSISTIVVQVWCLILWSVCMFISKWAWTECSHRSFSSVTFPLSCDVPQHSGYISSCCHSLSNCAVQSMHIWL